jgi:uncharacterized membrane protein YhaH (DUF805 family)
MDWKLFETEGRVRRLHYLAYCFVLAIASAAIQSIADLAFEPITSKIAGLVLCIPLYWASYCVAVRRAHDMGQGSSFVIWMCATVVAAMIVLCAGAIATALGSSRGGGLIGLALLLLLGYGVMNCILLFAPPSTNDEYGPNPR